MLNLLFKHSGSIKEALKQIDENGMQTLFVVDCNDKFLGTLSDGDLRRLILSGSDLNDSIGNRFNKTSIRISEEEESKTDFRKLFVENKIRAIPIICANGTVVNFKNAYEYIAHESKKGLEKVDIVIMAGGKGTRLAPFTDLFPKPLIPIGNKTIIEKIIDSFAEYGAGRYYITINYKAELMEAYFSAIDSAFEFIFLRENEFLGTASSLLLVPENISSTFIVSNCDILVQADYADLLEFHKKNRAALTIVSSMHHQTIPYGVVKFCNGGKVEAIDEKPEYSMPINTGIYILDRKCLKYIVPNKLFHMTDLIETLLKNDEMVMTYPVNEGDYIDIGQWKEYRLALERMR